MNALHQEHYQKGDPLGQPMHFNLKRLNALIINPNE